MWNPDADAEAIINDFLCGYYGPSAQYIREYINRLHNRITSSMHITEFLKLDNELFSDDLISQADRLFDEAEKAAPNPIIFRRVEMARFPIMYLKCYRTPRLAKFDGTYKRVKTIIEREPISHLSDKPENSLENFVKMMDNLH